MRAPTKHFPPLTIGPKIKCVTQNLIGSQQLHQEITEVAAK